MIRDPRNPPTAEELKGVVRIQNVKDLQDVFDKLWQKNGEEFMEDLRKQFNLPKAKGGKNGKTK